MTLLHPQAPLARHAVPAVLLVQSAHTAWPVTAHWAAVLPGSQVPLLAAEQQPPLQGCAALQLAEQVWVVRLQAFPVGQSASDVQPQTPLTHWSPEALPVQLVHRPPVAAQAVALMVAH